MILLTGATGNTGQVLATLLARAGLPFSAMVRSDRNAQILAGRGIATVRGDFDAPETLGAALRGVTSAYLVCTPDEHLVRREIAFIEAAEKAGVQRLVKCSAYLSGLHAETRNLRSHGVIEARLARSAMQWTVLRPTGFMQTFVLFSWDTVRYGAYMHPGGEGGIPLVDVRDVAAVAMKALTEDGHHGKVYDLTGPEAISFRRQAAMIGKAVGRPVRYLDIDEREISRMARVRGVPDVPLEHVIKVMRMVRERRLDATATTTLAQLGIPPTSFQTFVEDLIAGRTGGGNSFVPRDSFQVRVMKLLMPVMIRYRLWRSGRKG